MRNAPRCVVTRASCTLLGDHTYFLQFDLIPYTQKAHLPLGLCGFVGEVLAAFVLYFVSGPLSRQQPAWTDVSNLKGQKGGLKGGQAGGERVEGK